MLQDVMYPTPTNHNTGIRCRFREHEVQPEKSFGQVLDLLLAHLQYSVRKIRYSRHAVHEKSAVKDTDGNRLIFNDMMRFGRERNMFCTELQL